MTHGVSPKEIARRAFANALAALDPRLLCAEAAKDAQGAAIRLIAVGKAAARMSAGVCDAIGDRLAGGLCVTKEGHAIDQLPDSIRVIESSHPIPDERSLAAGRALWDEVSGAREPILLLLSGGASALAVMPAPGVDFAEKVRRTRALMASGATIHELNAERTRLSAIKGGRLIARAPVPVSALVLSDVLGDDLATIGGGLALGAPARILATPDDLAREAARALGSVVGSVDRMVTGFGGSVEELADLLCAEARAGRSAVVGGEPTIEVRAARPGRGGRAQHTALLCARALAGGSFHGAILAAASDGTDGPTAAAGGLVDAGTVARAGRDVESALSAYDAGSLLEAAGDLLVTGPTGNNLCDLYIVVPAR